MAVVSNTGTLTSSCFINHDMAFVMKNTVEVGLNLDSDGFAEHAARCSILHITKLEDLPEPVFR